MTMSYVIDVYRRQIEPCRSFRDFALFVCVLPASRGWTDPPAPGRLLPQLVKPRRVSTPASCVSGAWLIGLGYFKKVFVADNLATIVNAAFAPDSSVTGIEMLCAIYAFAFQIYGDFSGYTDIARGTSKLMGIELNLNFRVPYLAVSPSDFWRRWHISLSTWLRDYLYIPLGGKSRHAGGDEPEPHDHDGARRPLAWCRLAVRHLGRLPRRSADRLPVARDRDSASRLVRLVRLAPRVAGPDAAGPSSCSI